MSEYYFYIVSVKFLEDYGNYKKGDVGSLSIREAKQLAKKGIVEILE